MLSQYNHPFFQCHGTDAGLSKSDLAILNKEGLFNSLGKIRTPRTILDKPGKLTEEENDIIKKHPDDSTRIPEPITPYRDIIQAMLQLHERFDGTGCPRGPAGEGISPLGRIPAAADPFDAWRPTGPGGRERA